MGYRKAQYALGTDYQNGNGVPKDLKQAAYWLNLAAQQGSTSAQQQVAAIDPSKAMHYLQVGADQRDPQSEFDLAIDYELGTGVPHNRALAIDYFRRASRDNGLSTGDQLAAILTRTPPTRRFDKLRSLMALVPPPPTNPATSRPTGCPAWYDSTWFDSNARIFNDAQIFCIAHPDCSFSADNQKFTCDGDQSPLHFK